MMNEKKTYKIKKILLAAGESKRFGDKNKLLEIINGRPIINHILDISNSLNPFSINLSHLLL